MKYFFFIIALCLFCNALFSQNVVVSSINISGNKITKENVVLYELDFKTGDSIQLNSINQKLDRARYNLLNVGLFNFVDITYNKIDNKIDIYINLVERWYYVAYPIFENADRNLSSLFYYKNWHKYNYGFAFDWQNFRGRNELLKIKFRKGYKEHYSVYYLNPKLIVAKKHGYWTGVNYFRQKEIITSIIDNMPVYERFDDNYIYSNINSEIGYLYRVSLYSTAKIRLFYDDIIYDDNVIFSDNMINEKNENNLFIDLKWTFDNRDNINYPLNGGLFNLEARSPNIFNVHSFDNTALTINYQINTPISNILFSRSEILGMHIFQNNITDLAFAYQNVFSNNKTIRGYEYYYIYSPTFMSFNQTFSLVISDYREYSFKKIEFEQFTRFYSKLYLNYFFDISYSNKYINTDNSNLLNNKLLWSTGVGLALETYYDRVFEIRLAYNSFYKNYGIFVDYKTKILNPF